MNVSGLPVASASAPAADQRESLLRTIKHTQDLVDKWQPEVETDLANCENWRKTARFNDKLGLWGLKAAIAGGGLAALGGGASLLMGHGTLGCFPGLAIFAVGIVISQVGTMRRDNAQLEFSMKYTPALNRQEMLQNKLLPRLAEARAALHAQDEAEMKKLAEGLSQMGSIMESSNAVTVGGTRIRKR